MLRFAAIATLALTALMSFVVVLSGCPPNEIRIEISTAGVDRIVTSCTELSCPELSCCSDREPCDNRCCRRCDIGRTTAGPTDGASISVQLQLVDQNRKIVGQSPCMPLAQACLEFEDPNENIARISACLRAELNQAISDNLRSGLPLDGRDIEEVDLVLTVHSDPAAEETTCSAEHLFACAGLGETGVDTYDIECAQCASGVRFSELAINVQAASCFSDCFVKSCRDLL